MSIIVSISVVNAVTFYTWGTPRSQSPLSRLHGPVVGLARRGIQHNGHQVSAAVRRPDGDQLEYCDLENKLGALNTGRIGADVGDTLARRMCTGSALPSKTHSETRNVGSMLGALVGEAIGGVSPAKITTQAFSSAGLLIMHNG